MRHDAAGEQQNLGYRSAAWQTMEGQSEGDFFMRIVRPILLASLLLVPVTQVFAQGAPPAKPAAAPAATAKATAAPTATATATAKATAAPMTTVAPPAGAGASASHEISTEVDAAMNEKAQALFKEGNAAFRDAKYANAQAAYKAAWGIDLRNQRIVRNLGSTELELKMYRDAAEHLTIALRLADAADPKRSSIQKDLSEARSKVGTLAFKVTGGGQALDGVEIVQMETGRAYQTPLVDPIFVDAGKSSFRVRREGYESQEKVFDLKPGEESAVDVALARAPGFDGKTGATSPTGGAGAPAGGERSKVPGIVVGGVGVVAAIVGAALVGVASGKLSENVTIAPKDANGNPVCGKTPRAGEDPGCTTLRDNAEFALGPGNAGIGILAGGGVMIAAGALWLLIPSKKAATAKTSRVLPVVGTDGGGLVLTGSF